MKVDKGFELNYFKLSTRRKMIRTLWCGFFVLFVPIICYFIKVPSTISITITVVLLVIWTVMLLYSAYLVLME